MCTADSIMGMGYVVERVEFFFIHFSSTAILMLSVAADYFCRIVETLSHLTECSKLHLKKTNVFKLVKISLSGLQFLGTVD